MYFVNGTKRFFKSHRRNQMKKELVIRNATIIGLVIGMVIWICFYSNLFFKNIGSYIIISYELPFGLFFTSVIGYYFGETTKRLINKISPRQISIYSFIVLMISVSLFIVVLTGTIVTSYDYIPIIKYNLLLKIGILWIIINLLPLSVFLWSKKILSSKKVA